MAINLKKGQTIDLRKSSMGEVYDLSQITISLEWGMRIQMSTSAKQPDYDLDAMAFLLDANEQLQQKHDIIFFNAKKHPSGHIHLTGDNLTGGGDGEQIIANLDALDQCYQKILFWVMIFEGKNRKQHFGMLDSASICAVDAHKKEIGRYDISANSTMNDMCAMLFAEAYREGDTWKFRAVGDPYKEDKLIEHAKRYWPYQN